MPIGLQVILVANSRPALNDVIVGELSLVSSQIATMCPEISAALRENRLIIAENGQGSPCLDLR